MFVLCYCISFHHFNVFVENFPSYVPLYLYVCLCHGLHLSDLNKETTYLLTYKCHSYAEKKVTTSFMVHGVCGKKLPNVIKICILQQSRDTRVNQRKTNISENAITQCLPHNIRSAEIRKVSLSRH